jgi:hypothetical protein
MPKFQSQAQREAETFMVECSSLCQEKIPIRFGRFIPHSCLLMKPTLDNGGEAFDVAISSRVPKVLVISSAAPSCFRRMSKDARPIRLEKYL